MRRGRKTSSSEPHFTPVRSAPMPPATLTPQQRALFVQTVDAHPHLKSGDAILLAAFVQAVAKFEQLSKTDALADWDRCGRLMLALARALKLTSTTAARTLTRLREDHHPNLVAQYLAEHPDDDDSGLTQ
jgi:hypothetical protein